MNVLMPIHKSRCRTHRGFKCIELLHDELPQLRPTP